jgi:nicotinamidase-related amidase
MSERHASTNRALLLIDFQRDFLAPDGRMPVDQEQVEHLVTAAQRAVENAQAHGDLIVKIGNEFRPRDVIGNLFRHHAAVRGSDGAAWDERIDPPGATYIPKWRSDAFCNSALDAVLSEHEVGGVSLTGLYAKACVSATAKSARKRGLSVEVIGEATACSSSRSREVALAKLRHVGVRVV